MFCVTLFNVLIYHIGQHWKHVMAAGEREVSNLEGDAFAVVPKYVTNIEQNV
jgi:hypothetical protein